MSSGHVHSVRIYYEDTDFSGNVYHAAYLKFFERGRTEWLRDLGIHHSELARDGLAFAVTRMEIDYLGAAHIDDELLVATELKSLSGARVVLRQTISRGPEKLTRADVTIATINTMGKPVRLPGALQGLKKPKPAGLL